MAAKQRRRQRPRIGDAPDIQRQQQENGDKVEHPLHDDGRERGRYLETFLSGQQIWPQDVTGAGGKHAERRKADDRRPERGSKPRRPNRVKQVLPAPRTNYVSEDHRDEAREEQIDPRTLHLRPDAGKIRVAEKPREEGDRQKRHEERTHTHQNP